MPETHLICECIPAAAPLAAEPFLKAIPALRKRLQLDRDEGRERFDKAEALRKAEKWPDAIAAYRDLLKALPACKYAPRADLHIGDCLLGERKPAAAVEHWTRFVSVQPAGPWRGHAYIAMIDVYLEEVLDLAEAGKYATLAAGALPLAMADEKAAESWHLAAFELHVRIGLVNFCRNNGPAAAEAFEQAAKLALGKREAESLALLIAAAKAGKGVIPADCLPTGATGLGPVNPGESAIRNPQSAISLALSMGVIYNLCGRPEKADDFFDRVRGVPPVPAKPGHPGVPGRPAMAGATPAQLAFAMFGKGAVLQARGKTEEAKEFFLASIKAHRDGTWHDETLYRLAMIIQDHAAAQFAPPKPAASGKGAGSSGTAARPEIRDPQSAIRNERDRLAALLKAKSEALPYWQEITRKYPESPRCEQALYFGGVLLYELAEAVCSGELGRTAPVDKTEVLWKQALTVLGRFTDHYAKSPYAGDAYVKQIEIALERLFDLEQANALVKSSLEWVAGGGTQEKTRSHGPRSPWFTGVSDPNETCLENARRVILRSSVLTLFLMGQQEKAKGMLELLHKRLPAGPRNEWDDYDRMKWGVEHGHFYAYPAELVHFTGKPRMALLIADYHYILMDFERSAGIAEDLLAGKHGVLSREQAAYVSFLNGASLCWLGQKERGLKQFQRAYDSACPTGKNVSVTQDRAMYAAARTALSMNNATEREWGHKLLQQLAASDRINEFTGKAQVACGIMLLEQGRVDEGVAALQKVVNNNNPVCRPAAEGYLRLFRKTQEKSKGTTPQAERNR